MYLIVGLGNPGRQYEATRHNMGFDTVDCLIEKHNVPQGGVKFNAMYGKGIIGGDKAILMKPLTFMTLSGGPVRDMVNGFKINPEKELIVISDEIYAELTYGDEPHVSIASLPGMWERTILLNGFSKAFAMTGWRLGYAAAPPEFMNEMVKIHQYVIMCAPTVSQYAGLEALTNYRREDELAIMRDAYDERRRVMVDGFRAMGLDCFEPQGAFYVFPSIQTTGLSSEEFCERLLYENHTAVVPGTAFGDSGEGFIRCSYAYSIKSIQIALERIEEFLKTLK